MCGDVQTSEVRSAADQQPMCLARHAYIQHQRMVCGLVDLLNPTAAQERGNFRKNRCHIRRGQHNESMPLFARRLDLRLNVVS